MTTIASQCAFCKHLRPTKPEERVSCAAFPDGISSEILLNKQDHRQPLEGDKGIQFEAVEGFQHPMEEDDAD